jgi:predicted dehydrogenase
MNIDQRKMRFAAVGTGGRIPMFIDPIVRDYEDNCELVAMCDTSNVRMEYHQKRLRDQYGFAGTKLYAAGNFDKMLDDTGPDVVIVCTMDAHHHEYVIRSVAKGCDVICEKPLTINEAGCQAILDSVRKSGRRVRVTFNYRWTPGVTKVREMLAQGMIGKVNHVHMEYLLDTSHGADYFRRWHSNKKNSGGLLVHKSTHHFDLVNWWINGIPESVYAVGQLAFYGRKNALARKEEHLTRYERYTGENTKGDPFRLDLLDSDESRKLYLNAEAETGYLRDRNVFREDIDIEDSLSVIVKYRHGVMLNYSLNAYGPWEGFRVSFNGDKGRIEYEEVHKAAGGPVGAGKKQAPDDAFYRIRHMPLFDGERIIDVPKMAGGHGGGDALIQEQMFARHPAVDNFGRNAEHEQGAASAIIGIAGNRSMITGLPVRISDLIDLKPEAIYLHELL